MRPLVLRFDHWWGAWLAAAAGIPRRIGYDRPETRPFLTDALPYHAERHEVEQNAGLVPPRGTDAARARPAALHRHGRRARLGRFLAADQRRCRRSPAGRDPSRRRRRRQTMAGRRLGRGGVGLTTAFSARILLTGARRSGRFTAAIAAALPEPPLDASGQTNSRPARRLAGTLRVGARLGFRPAAPGRGCRHADGASLWPGFADQIRAVGRPASSHRSYGPNWPCAPCNRLDWPAAELAQHACMAAITPAHVLRRSRRVRPAVILIRRHRDP